MNSEPSPTERRAGQALVAAYLIIILVFSLLYLASAHWGETQQNIQPKSVVTWDVELSVGKDEQGLTAELYFRVR